MTDSIVDINQAKKAQLKTRLRRCYEALRQSRLQRFLLGVLGNPVIQRPFFTLPASLEHHHSYSGGLCIHSLECELSTCNLGFQGIPTNQENEGGTEAAKDVGEQSSR